ncbi:hypothetical protein BKA66DRAFT_421812, partial [Pyrenochaeta sp. MPI-SDFR-AT-0127]
GFTIYRTFYRSGSDQPWESLILKITTSAESGLNMLNEAEDDPLTTTKVFTLFELDARSDPTTLEGLILELVRELCNEGTGGQPMNTTGITWRVFILADAKVLADPDVIKCVAADYNAAEWVPRSWRAGPETFFG